MLPKIDLLTENLARLFKTMRESWVKRFDIDIGSKEFFKLAKMEFIDAICYIQEKYGRNEVNYFYKYMMPRYFNRKIANESELR